MTAPVPTALEIPVRLGRDEARRLAAEELSKAKYGGVPPELARAARRVFERLVSVVDWVFSHLQRTPSVGGGLSPAAVLVVVLLLVAVALIVWRVGLPRWRHRAPVETVEVDPTVSPATYRARAARAAGTGDFRSAIGEEFRGLVRELEQRTVLDPRPARTATEVALGAGGRLPAARDELDRTAALFNDAWYGGEVARAAPDAVTYRTFVGLSRRVLAVADATDLTAEAPGTTPTAVRR